MTKSAISYIINITNNYLLKGDYNMATKREYLKSKGITVGARGRFSAAAKQALTEAQSQGVTFEAEKPTPKK